MGSERHGVNGNAHPGCPDVEQLAAYLDGTLSDDARRTVERHAADCEDCRMILAETADYLEGGTAPRPNRFAQTRRLWVAAAVLAAAAAVVVSVRLATGPFGRGVDRRDASSSSSSALLAALSQGPTRPVEGRLPGLPYAPAPSSTRGASDARPSAGLRIAAAAVEKEAASASAPAKRIELGVALLAVGDLDRAVHTLEGAVADAGTADGYTDLAAAYLARGLRTGATTDLPAALDAARRARQIQPDSLPARFNETLILEAMNRREEAVQAMQAYLAVDAASPWADELRARLRQR